MKRRNFLKGLLSVGAAVAAPSLAAKVAEGNPYIGKADIPMNHFTDNGKSLCGKIESISENFNSMYEIRIVGLEKGTCAIVDVTGSVFEYKIVNFENEALSFFYSNSDIGKIAFISIYKTNNLYSKTSITLDKRGTLYHHVLVLGNSLYD